MSDTELQEREIKLIDLEKYRDPGVGIFAGRGRAKAIRANLGIHDGDHVELRVPSDVYCLAAGFADTLLWKLTLRKIIAPRLILPQLQDAGMDTDLLDMPLPDTGDMAALDENDAFYELLFEFSASSGEQRKGALARIEAYIAVLVKAERKACAKIAMKHLCPAHPLGIGIPEAIAKEIRARSTPSTDSP